MQQYNNHNSRNQRYNPYWDCSNQNKRYTEEEKTFIEQSWKEGMTAIEIAKILKRGLWAVEVQIMYIKQNKNIHYRSSYSSYSSFKPQQKRQKQQLQQQQRVQRQQVQTHIPQQLQQQQEQQQKQKYNPNLKFCAQQNRKFNGKQIIVKSNKTETQNHIYELMGL